MDKKTLFRELTKKLKEEGSLLLGKEEVKKLRKDELSDFIFNKDVKFDKDAEKALIRKESFAFMLRVLRIEKESIYERIGEKNLVTIAFSPKDSRSSIGAIKELRKNGYEFNEKQRNEFVKSNLRLDVIQEVFQNGGEIPEEEWIFAISYHPLLAVAQVLKENPISQELAKLVRAFGDIKGKVIEEDRLNKRVAEYETLKLKDAFAQEPKKIKKRVL